MAPPDWLNEKRLSPEERMKQGRERMSKLLEKQAQEKLKEKNPRQEPQHGVSEADSSRRSSESALQSPIIGVGLLRLDKSQEPDKTDRAMKRKRAVEHEQPFRRASAPGITRPSGTRSNESSTPQSPATGSDEGSSAGVRQLPSWYRNINAKKLSAAGSNRNVDAKLEQIKDRIKACKQNPSRPEMKRLFNMIRDELHDLVFLQVSEIALRRKRMLHDDSGLPQLFDSSLNGIEFPWDIKADAQELYTRWALGIFQVDLLRGIIKKPTTAQANRSTDRIDPSYPGKRAADYPGQGGLVNGQWWPTQLCTVRDGAHGSTQGGIYAKKDKPAFSIILSGGYEYHDRDAGDEIWYSGTDGKDGKFSENTQSMMLNISTKQPVRVIRSHNIAQKTSAYRPARGFRYDGLYDVISYEIINQEKMACLFHLVRQPKQDPIRYQGKEARPTEAEVREYDRLRAEIEASERL